MDKDIENILLAVIRLAVKQARQVTDDQEALSIKKLYKQWDKQMGKTLNVGEYIQHGNRLYRVLQQHVVQGNWEPGIGTESLYVVIDVKHEGTIVDPIPWNSNMECFSGKYYIEDGVLYLCIRDSGIALQFKAADLIGNYFNVYVEDEIIDTPIEDEEVGTLENPIDVANMNLPITYEIDKYYKEDEIIYKCTRTETLHFLPSALVGNYFEIVE